MHQEDAKECVRFWHLRSIGVTESSRAAEGTGADTGEECQDAVPQGSKKERGSAGEGEKVYDGGGRGDAAAEERKTSKECAFVMSNNVQKCKAFLAGHTLPREEKRERLCHCRVK